MISRPFNNPATAGLDEALRNLPVEMDDFKASVRGKA